MSARDGYEKNMRKRYQVLTIAAGQLVSNADDSTSHLTPSSARFT
jgi:hypothetical protein